MSVNGNAPWHKASWDRFITAWLPERLAECLPLADYSVQSESTYACRIAIAIETPSGGERVVYSGVPQPDEAGLFKVDGQFRVVIPVPTEIDLAVAQIRCVGELLRDELAGRLSEAPDHVAWTEGLVREWLPLDRWIREFLLTSEMSQFLQRTNWLDMHTHMRRITLAPLLGSARGPEGVFLPSHPGRTCLFCTPEGPNIARVLEISQGAEIRDGKLVASEDPAGGLLGLGASCVPFSEHDDANRLLMGVNMMRQWISPPGGDTPRDETGTWFDYHGRFDAAGDAPAPEPALVQTGVEPEQADFWAGQNLLTAFVSWDGFSHEDGLALSASAAKRMQFPQPVEVGDKLSNRHGAKGVVGTILPDDEMPHLPDGTAVELIFSVSSVPSRMNFGQIREAVMGRIAHAEGHPAVVPPFGAPSEGDLRARLKAAGLPEDGMAALSIKGKALDRRSTVGWVYWGRTLHLASDKIHQATTAAEGNGVHLGEGEYQTLCDLGVSGLVEEFYNTLAQRRDGADGLAARAAAGTVEPAGPPSPRFVALAERLAAGGVRAVYDEQGVSFRFEAADGMKLAKVVPHPWLPWRSLEAVGRRPGDAAFEALEAVNDRLTRMLETRAPAALVDRASAQLEACAKVFVEALVQPAHLQFDERVLFSGRSVLVPGPDLRPDQVGVPEEMAWTLFGPLAARALGGENDLRKRTKKAAQALDAAMARAWVVVYRGPVFSPRPMIAFHPVRCTGRAIRLPLAVCRLMNADFDGDQAAVFLPLTEGGQQVAGARLSLVAYLTAQPALCQEIVPSHDAMLGLAQLSMTSAGRTEISELAGVPVEEKLLSRKTLGAVLRAVLDRDGAQAAIDVAEKLRRRGFERARQMGASMSPFPGSTLAVPPQPEGDDPDQWRAYAEEVEGWLRGLRDFEADDLGAILMMIQSGARANWHQLRQYLGGTGVVRDVHGTLVPIPNGWRDGISPEEAVARVAGARWGLGNVLAEMADMERDLFARSAPGGYNALVRARRSLNPGVVFARAAMKEESDPLTDAYSRLFVGVSVKK